MLSVVDTDLIRLKFEGTEIHQTEIDSDHYLTRYIIRKRDVFARVRFIKASVFPVALEDYNRLHRANCNWFGDECDSFYAGVLEDWDRREALAEDFSRRFKFHVGWRLQDRFKREFDLSKLMLYWEKATSQPQVGFELPDDVLEYMNQDPETMKYIANALKATYRYDGPFTVTFDIPF